MDKKLLKLIPAIGLPAIGLIALLGISNFCDNPRKPIKQKSYSKIMTEKGEVEQVSLNPSIFIEVPEMYTIVFRCEHNVRLVIEEEREKEQKYKALWDRFEKGDIKEGDKVTITYREEYVDTLHDIDRDGKREIISRKAVGYDFLDAKVVKE